MKVGLGSETVTVDVTNLTVVTMIPNEGPESDVEDISELP